jgi:hypothetical protein
MKPMISTIQTVNLQIIILLATVFIIITSSVERLIDPHNIMEVTMKDGDNTNVVFMNNNDGDDDDAATTAAATTGSIIVLNDMKPRPASVDLKKTALIIIDMQIDFLEVRT